jgi:chemotaxis protein methyltransferase CheR
LLHKSLLYGTDLNQGVLHAAMKRTYSKSTLKVDSGNYILSGGNQKLSDYYSENENTIQFHEFLSKHMVFSNHNLTIDQSFNEFNLILCRNVLIYFNRNLQDKVFKLFTESMAEAAFLALGTKETLEFSSVTEQFEIVDKKNRIWKVKTS